MKVIYDVVEHKNHIKKAIRKYGYFAEHNYLHYLYNESGSDKNTFFDFGNDRILLAQQNKKKNTWEFFPNGILSPEPERLSLLLGAVNYVLREKKAKKIVVEVSESIRKGILNKFKIRNGFKACKAYTLYWPVYKMDSWNPKLRGSKWKKLRNVRNRFYKRNRVRVRDSKGVPKEELKRILSRWLERRNDTDRVKKSYYLNLIDNNFKGVDMAKTLYVNGKACTLTAGWKIPNSNNYYSSVGIIDYSHPGLGEVANLDDLNRLKRGGFDYVDFGGSDKVLLYFKKKFKPEKIYRTYTFSIIKR
ncbi:DUF2156 domain-containing protein [Candidatus Woesearchaeota archaeon]|nr:DUF2156 domain-containing protein [Candidatus Woesearchaeota archaeon]